MPDPLAGTRRGFDFRHFWHALVERLWLVALCFLAGLFLGIGYVARTPKLYQGHTVLEVGFQEPTVVADEGASARGRPMFLATQEALRTIEQNLTNRSLMSRVVRAEGLAADGGRALVGQNINANADGQSSPTPASTPATAVTTGGNVITPMTFTPVEDALGGALSRMVKPVIRRGTRLIDLYVTHTDPAMAARLAEAVGREYIRSAIEQRATFSQETLRYLLEEEERLKANLQKSEAAVADYKARTPDALQLGGGAGSTGSQAGAGSTGSRGGLVEDKLQELSSKLTAAKSERVRLEGELAQIDKAGDKVDALLAIPSIANAPVVNERRHDLAQLESTVAALAQRYKDRHPKMMAARAAMTEAKDALGRAVLAQPAVLRNTVEQMRAGETSLDAAVREQEKAALALNKAASGYQELARQAETDRALYESVLRQIKEADLTKGVKATAVTVVEHSPVPHAPITASGTKAVSLGLLAGLAAGLALVFGLDALDRSIKTVDQAEMTLGLPVLAAVPEMKKGGIPKRAGRDPGEEATSGYRLVAEAPEGPAAEAFRNLRAGLGLLGPEAERKVFLFTSALPGEGKSFTSANYALSLAQQGYRVLLVDGDLRRPSLHKIFLHNTHPETTGKRVEPPGIVDCLVGTSTLAAATGAVSPNEIDGSANKITTSTGGQLSVLSGGRRAPNPAELLGGPSFGALISEASMLFDRVVVDSAPVLAVSDTLLMAPYVQTVCLVVRAAKTSRNAVQRAISLLAAARSHAAGVVLNRLPKRAGAGYYYYYASPGYGAGEGSYGSRYGTQSATAPAQSANGSG
jgi:capsular exopolysaccharide synthesis family protein